MSTIDLSICKVTETQNFYHISIPYWIPTFYITKVNDQKYFDISVEKAFIKDNRLPLKIVIDKMDELASKNPYKNLRAKNPHIVDYRRKNIGTFAPKKTAVKISSVELDKKRDELNKRTSLYVPTPDHTFYYVESK